MPGKGVKESPGLSQEQMLWGVLALLCTAVVCFAAGILVNKIQSRPDVGANETARVERLPGAKDTASREPVNKEPRDTKPVASADAEGVQVSPAPVVMPGGSKDSAPPSRPVTQREANTQFVPAPPPQRDDASAPKTDTPKAAPADVISAAPAQPSTPAPEAPKPVELAAQPAAPAAPSAAPGPGTPMDDIPAGAAPAAPAEASGAFTIQIGSFDSMAAAEKFKKTVEAKSDHTVTLHPSKDGKVVKACVGTYETKEAAAKERAELDRVKDFKGCFVKALAEL